MPQLSGPVARPGKPVTISPLSGTGKTLFYAALLHKYRSPSLIITAREDEAKRIYDELKYFLDALDPAKGIALFPAPDTLPHEAIAPSSDILSVRSRILWKLTESKPQIIVASLKAVLTKTIAKTVFKPLVIRTKAHAPTWDELLEQLVALGYQRVSMVEEIGEFAARGSIVDIFSFGQDQPFRIEYFGDTIESIRAFDITTQRSFHIGNTAKILPAEKTLPAKSRGSFLDYLAPATRVLLDDKKSAADQARHLFEEAKLTQPTAFKLTDHYLTWDKLIKDLAPYALIETSPLPGARHQEIMINISKPDNYHGNIPALAEQLRRAELTPVFITKNMERLHELLLPENVPPYSLLFGNLSNGVILNDLRIGLFTDNELFGELPHPKIHVKAPRGAAPELAEDFISGEYVVHENYGIGIYRGLEVLTIGGKPSEYIHIQFAGSDKLYISPDQMRYIFRYSGSKDVVPALSRLGSGEWQRTKLRTQKAIRNLTQELLDLYQIRESKPGFAFPPDHPWQKDFEASFPYDETPDQITALRALKQDMEDPWPMDRLLCGDVGFGKTEVALRAAFKAATAGKQVAILAPTTILVEQHYNNFKERLSPFPITLEMLSRFRSRKEQQATIKLLTAGGIDIIVGTHRLLQKDVAFKDLGLLIIDEEQRFGVSSKERLKQLKKTVDVLTLTATPIPRTLYLSLSGTWDMSMINTPPLNRSPIRTYVMEENSSIIKEAIIRELERGGQVYFLHDTVHNIAKIAEQIQKLLPRARVGVAHGQMASRKLEVAMLDFIHKHIDILVCTTIIESGIDIPSVNTIIINHAQRFGLADLYQLRGRVGRSDVNAFAYLLYEKGKVLTDDALERLSAIADYSALGSGYKIALRDLEIRGAGNVLGAEQHGHMLSVGFDLYSAMLDRTVKALKGMPTSEKKEIKINIGFAAFIPREYVPEERERISLYKRLNFTDTIPEIENIRSEMADRYGPLPPPVKNLLKVTEIKLKAQKAGIKKLEGKTLAELEKQAALW